MALAQTGGVPGGSPLEGVWGGRGREEQAEPSTGADRAHGALWSAGAAQGAAAHRGRSALNPNRFPYLSAQGV